MDQLTLGILKQFNYFENYHCQFIHLFDTMAPEMKKIAIIFILFAFCRAPVAYSAKSEFDLYAGLGNLSEFPGTIQTDDQGTTNSFSLIPTLQVGIKYDVWGNFSLNPELILTLPRKGRDPLISKFNYFTLLSAAYNYHDFLFRFGLGLSLQRISGEGGTQALNNGLGTDEFPMPETSSVSQNLITLLGVEYFIVDQVSVRTDVFAYNIEDNLNRAVSYNLSFMYHFGDLELFSDTKKKKRKKRRRRRKIKRKTVKENETFY
jgi:hypothetical protein